MAGVTTTPGSRADSAVGAGGDAGRPVTGGVVVALLTVYLVWGSTYLAIRYTVADLPPLLAMGVRFLLAGALMAAALRVFRGRAVFRMTRQEMATAAGCSSSWGATAWSPSPSRTSTRASPRC
jgi:drug/metabolite transporter (DMT)-like permease